jgi:hypothetical protein
MIPNEQISIQRLINLFSNIWEEKRKFHEPDLNNLFELHKITSEEELITKGGLVESRNNDGYYQNKKKRFSTRRRWSYQSNPQNPRREHG